MQRPENNLITIQTYKEVTRLYKTFLELIEDIRGDHILMMNKISEKYGPDEAKNIDYFTKEKYEQIRKKILDSGNETTRQLISFLDFYDFQVNVAKLEEAAKQRKVIKKFVTSSLLKIE